MSAETLYSEGRPIWRLNDWWVQVACPACDGTHIHPESAAGHEVVAPCGVKYELQTHGE